MPDPPVFDPGLRADARHNQARILDAAYAVISELGDDFTLNDVAAYSGIGLSTVYRRFAGRQELIQAVFDRYVTEEVEPLVAASVRHPDPWQALVDGVEAVVVTAAAHATLLTLARDTALVTAASTASFTGPLGDALRRAQAAGVVRPDLLPADLPALIAMVVTTMVAVPAPPGEQPVRWRRYLALLLDGCHPDTSRPELPHPPK